MVFRTCIWFPVVLRGRPETSACSSAGEPTTSKPWRPRMSFGKFYRASASVGPQRPPGLPVPGRCPRLDEVGCRRIELQIGDEALVPCRAAAADSGDPRALSRVVPVDRERETG